MELRDLLKKIIFSYFIIYGCCFLGTWLYCSIFDPDSLFGLDYFLNMAVFSLIGDLPSLIFYSSHELTKRQWNRRLLLHLLVLETALLAMGKYLDLYHTMFQGAFFAGIILLVYAIVRLFCFSWDLGTARAINDRLEELKK